MTVGDYYFSIDEKLDRVIHLFVLGGLKLNKLDLKQYTTYSHTGIHAPLSVLV